MSLRLVALSLFLCVPAFSQSPNGADPSASAATATTQAAPEPAETRAASPAEAMITGFKDSDVKFDVNKLVDILRDRRHEGWVLAAYPDPKTGQPLIGAGFSLDLPEREHAQTDPLNAHPFLEPSSAELWQAAGFGAARLNDILNVFYERKQEWSKRRWRRELYSLPAQISDEDATQLVRVGAIQAIYNAQAYCRNFAQLTGPQQLALAQLVYQMGVNLQHFSEFLGMINSGFGPAPEPQPAETDTMALIPAPGATAAVGDQTPEYWEGVQRSLMGSQWAHKYRTRAIAVIAMLDPAYGDDPTAAEQRVSAVLRPAVRHRRRGRGHGAAQQVAASVHHRPGRRSATRSRKRA